jgi:hypothetical protein
MADGEMLDVRGGSAEYRCVDYCVSEYAIVNESVSEGDSICADLLVLAEKERTSTLLTGPASSAPATTTTARVPHGATRTRPSIAAHASISGLTSARCAGV